MIRLEKTVMTNDEDGVQTIELNFLPGTFAEGEREVDVLVYKKGELDLILEDFRRVLTGAYIFERREIF